jgi:hypothetical protein
MYAILTRNDVSLDKNSEETNAHVLHVKSAFTGRHADLLTLLKQAEGTFKAKLIKEREERIKVAGMVAKVLTAMNETRVGLNNLTADVLNLCEATKIGERLDNLDTELVALKTRDPQVAVCMAPLMGHLLPPKLDCPLLYTLVVGSNHANINAPAVCGGIYHCGCGKGACNGGAQGKRPADGEYPVTGKCPCHDRLTEQYNPSLHQFTSTSSAPFPFAASFAIIGPCDTAGDPFTIFNSILTLLPDSVFYASDHFSSIREGQYVHVGFKGINTAKGLVNLWERTNPLQGSTYELEVRTAEVRDNAINSLFGLKN